MKHNIYFWCFSIQRPDGLYMCLSSWYRELASLLVSDIETVSAGIMLAVVRGNLDLECFRLRKTLGSHGWPQTSSDSCIVITGWVFSEVYKFPERDTNLWKCWQSLNRLVMVFLKLSVWKSLCALLYKGLVSCRWPVGCALGTAVPQIGIMAGVASWGADSAPHTPHWILLPELLA